MSSSVKVCDPGHIFGRQNHCGTGERPRRWHRWTAKLATTAAVFWTAFAGPMGPASGAAITQEGPGASVDIPSLKDFRIVDQVDIQAQGDSRRATLLLDDEFRTLHLEPHSIRALDFQVLVQGDDGILRPVDPPPVRTYRGWVEGVDGSVIAGSVVDGKLWALIRMPDGEVWNVEPLSEITDDPDAPAGAHITYRGDDVEPRENFCGVPDDALPVATGGDDGGIAGTGIEVARLGVDTDVEYFQDNNSNVATTVNDIENVLNSVESVYEDDVNVAFEVTTIIVRTGALTSDPYTTTNSDNFLCEFRDTWNSTPESNIDCDVAHLFTAKNLDGGTIGVAWIGVVCNQEAFSNCTGFGNLAYGLVQSQDPGVDDLTFNSRVALSAHELGHNFGAGHCDNDGGDCHIMCSGLGGCGGIVGSNLTFEPASTPEMNSFINTLGCLDVLSDPVVAPFTETFPNTSLIAARWSYNNLGAVTSNGTNEPSSPNSLQLDSAGSAEYQDDDVRTNFILLEGLSGVTASYFTQWGPSVESGEQLIVDYWADNLQWINLNTITSNGVDQTSFTQHTHVLPSSALHDEFRLRFRTLGDQGDDDWFIDNVTVSTAPSSVVTVDSQGATGVTITASPADQSSDTSGVTPFNLDYISGTQITLTAPLTAANGTFFHSWLINGGFAGSTLGLTFTVNANTTATAVYAPLQILTIDSDPPDGLTITVSPPDYFNQGNGSTPFNRGYFAGASVTLTAPASATGFTFNRWIVNGVNQPVGQLAVVVAVNAATTAVANYVPNVSTLSTSSTPISAVSITASPVDNNGSGGGPTPLSLVYNNGANVNLTAPLSAQGHDFNRWNINGVDQPVGQNTIAVAVSANTTLVAQYIAPLDSDGDGTPDSQDGCPFDPLKIAPGICGCGVPDTDSDGDGTPNCNDGCPNDPLKTSPGACGCGNPDTDTDGDGTADCVDGCPSDPLKTRPGACGCGVPDTDSDGDGTPDCNDGCPDDPAKTKPGICGCGVSDVDTDGDDTADCLDGCPSDPLKTDPGVCGCGVPDTDTDGDGVPDCIDDCPKKNDIDSDGDGVLDCDDGCPLDPDKIEPGICGCGVAETDTDADGSPDCIDGCPDDPDKTEPGDCGCGVADTDSDGDGTADCIDGCPSDPDKTAPGQCGCGNPDTDTDGDGTADCIDGCPNDPDRTEPGDCGCGAPEVDTDGDGLLDCQDNCPSIPNELQEDCNDDGTGDACDPAAVDCNGNLVPDDCDIAEGTSADDNANGVPDECEKTSCPTDISPSGAGGGDGVVGAADLGELLANWGQCPPPELEECPADFSGDGSVGAADLGELLATWGPCQ